MEMFIIYAQGMHPKVVIWTIERQDSLRSMWLTAAGISQAVASPVGDVPEEKEREAELVRRPSPCPMAIQCTTTKQRKDEQMATTSSYVVNKLSLMSLEDWEIVNNSQGLAKLQHNLQRTMRRVGMKVGRSYSDPRRRLPCSC